MATQAGIPIGAERGYIAVFDPDPTTGGFFILDNAAYELGEADMAMDYMTQSLSGGAEKAVHRSSVFLGVTVTMPEDNPSSIETNALVRGAAYDLWCRRGNVPDPTVRFDLVEGAVFRSVKKTNPTGTGMARRVVLIFERGKYSPLQEASEELIVYLIAEERESS